MKQYVTANLVNVDAAAFRTKIDKFLSTADAQIEGYTDSSMQRDLSIQFHWGHNHDFGAFALKGRMGSRHLMVPTLFNELFQALPADLTGKRILDIGCWTGGMAMLFHSLGAKVVSLEEVTKYADACKYMRDAFAMENWQIENISLFELESLGLDDYFDYVVYSGVLYHVTDMVLSLRLCFNAVRDGGSILIESQALPTDQPLVKYECARVVFSGEQASLNRGGWNWYVPSPVVIEQMMADVGFDYVVSKMPIPERCYATGKRTSHRDMLRAGLARRDIR